MDAACRAGGLPAAKFSPPRSTIRRRLFSFSAGSCDGCETSELWSWHSESARSVKQLVVEGHHRAGTSSRIYDPVRRRMLVFGGTIVTLLQ